MLGSALGPPLALGLLDLLTIGEVYRLCAAFFGLIVLFALAFTISEFLAYLERRVSYYAAKR